MTSADVPTHVIRDQFGHASLAVTARYIRRLIPREVMDTMRELDLLSGAS